VLSFVIVADASPMRRSDTVTERATGRADGHRARLGTTLAIELDDAEPAWSAALPPRPSVTSKPAGRGRCLQFPRAKVNHHLARKVKAHLAHDSGRQRCQAHRYATPWLHLMRDTPTALL